MRARSPRRPVSLGAWLLLAIIAAAALSACLPVARPLIKIALVAPFEGRYRAVGYEVLNAVRLAVREANAAGGAGGYSLALMAYDDGGDAGQAIEQARKAATDPDVLGVIGHWRSATTAAAAPTYAETGLPLLAPNPESADLPAAIYRLGLSAAAERAAVPPDAHQCPAPCDALDDLTWLLALRAQSPAAARYGPPLWGQAQFLALAGPAAEGAFFLTAAPSPADSPDPGFAARYTAISNGVLPRADAVLAYDAARLLIQAIADSASDELTPDRTGVATALDAISFDGLSGLITFDAQRQWASPKAWVYQWQAGAAVLVH